MNRTICLIYIVAICTSCQKKYSDNYSRDEIIIEFAARLEEQSPSYQYDHSHNTLHKNKALPSSFKK